VSAPVSAAPAPPTALRNTLPLPAPRDNRPFAAALIATSPMVPIASILLSALVYIGGAPYWAVPAVGWAVFFVVWPLAALAVRDTMSAQRASPRRYGMLRKALLELDAHLAITQHDDLIAPLPDDGSPATAAWNEAVGYRNAILADLAIQDARWVLGIGYVNAWTLLYQAKEATIEYEPADAVLEVALYDEQRLNGSNIDNADLLLDKLRRAVLRLYPDSTCYLSRLPAGCEAAATHQKDRMDALAVLRTVRNTIDEYRDERWMGIVRARNQLMLAVFVTGVLTTVLVGYVAIVKGPYPTFVTITGLYLGGAIVGLFNRLYIESKADTAVDDFGLATARLITTVLFSGLAAVGGVLVTIMLYNTVLPPTARGNAPQTLGIDDIFNLQNYPLDVVIAAIFGLAPSLLISSLQQQVARYVGDIRSSSASDGSHA
jgi:hypothetical protein